MARAALVGLKVYQSAARDEAPAPRPQIARERGACLRDYGGSGAPAVLVPSLINPPRILDLDGEVSLAGAMTRMGRRVLLLDWGRADDRSDLSVSGHVEHLLQPLLRSIGQPAALVGYCLGGTMAIAAAGMIPVERVATLAAPWSFSHYPAESRGALADMWRNSKPASRTLGALPMEVLQAAFWSLDPQRTVGKFAELGRLEPGSAEARRFVALEDWANEGEPLPYPAARELIEDLFGRDLPGSGEWRVGGRAAGDALAVPALHILAGKDRIAPAPTAPKGPAMRLETGHVGMIVGSARTELHAGLRQFLDPACRSPG
ncbi:MAG: alpha/beta fold hydrolase [Sphingomicrobium sp.]